MAQSKKVEYDLVDVINEWVNYSQDGWGPEWSDPISGQDLTLDDYTERVVVGITGPDGEEIGLHGAMLVTWRE